jgi:hypothetical protein
VAVCEAGRVFLVGFDKILLNGGWCHCAAWLLLEAFVSACILR